MMVAGSPSLPGVKQMSTGKAAGIANIFQDTAGRRTNEAK